MIRIAPSILTADLPNLEKQIRFLEEGDADLIHLDVMDGHFVPNITFGPMMVKTIHRLTKLPLDVHLMITEPEKYIDKFVESGADYLTIHQEATIHLHRSITHIKSLGAKAGVSLNPSTPVHLLSDILDIVDMVLIMSVNPGFGGQRFIESSLQKIASVKQTVCSKNLNTLIEVDGGINYDNVEKIVSNGANMLVIGNSIFDSPDIPNAVKKFKEIVNIPSNK
jgi:ribulose-phosphate 3-epimerase